MELVLGIVTSYIFNNPCSDNHNNCIFNWFEKEIRHEKESSSILCSKQRTEKSGGKEQSKGSRMSQNLLKEKRQAWKLVCFSLERICGGLTMGIEEAYAFFGKPRAYDNKIKRIESTIEGLRSCLLPGGIRYDKDRVQTTPSDKMTEIVCRITDLEKELEEEQQNRANAVMEIDKALMKLPEGPYRTILAESYIGRISNYKIAEGMGITVRHYFRMRKKAVETFCEIMNK